MAILIRETLTRVRAPLREVGLNTIAFGMIIAAQQLFVFPGLSRMTTAVGFSQVILLITISTIVVNVLGNEASKVSLIRGEAYRRRGLPWDTPRLVLGGMILAALAIVLVTVATSISWELSLQYGLITLLGIARTFGTTPDKHTGAFHRVVIAHGTYAAGALGGLFLVQPLGSPYVPFLAAEALALAVVVLIRIRYRDVAWTVRRTVEFRPTMHSFLGLGLIAVLINAVTYLDRLTITPLIGAGALAVYYSASALSSSLSLITNPGGNAMLARLGRMSDERRGQVFTQGLLLAIPLVLVCWAGSFIIALGGLVVLYPSHLQAALPLLAPISLAAAFSNAVALLSPLLQRFLPVRRLLWFYLPYTIVYLAAITVFSALWSLNGFAWASALANAMLFAMYLVQIRRTARSASGPPLPAPEPARTRTARGVTASTPAAPSEPSMRTVSTS